MLGYTQKRAMKTFKLFNTKCRFKLYKYLLNTELQKYLNTNTKYYRLY